LFIFDLSRDAANFLVSDGAPQPLFLINEYVACYQLKGLTLVDALRTLVHRFRLPGEASMIDRVMFALANRWFSVNKNSAPDVVRDIADADATYLLLFAIVMMNTEFHARAPSTYTLVQWKNGLRQGNAGSDFSGELLADLFADIKARPVLPPFHQPRPAAGEKSRCIIA
jgi:brefeldin A-resistance guanine nucleotide exchange factor 1